MAGKGGTFCLRAKNLEPNVGERLGCLRVRRADGKASSVAEREKASVPLLDDSIHQIENFSNFAGDHLSSSPIQSDHSSSIKSIEPAMERRVSLLFHGGERPDVMISTPRISNQLMSSPHYEKVSTPEPKISPTGRKLKDYRRFSSFSTHRFDFEPQAFSGRTITSVSPSPLTRRESIFNKRLSTVAKREPMSSPSKATSELPARLNGNTSPLRAGLDTGRKFFGMAKTAITNRPLNSSKQTKQKPQRNVDITDTEGVSNKASDSGQKHTVYSPSSLFFDAPGIPIEPWLPTDKTRVPTHPQTPVANSSFTDDVSRPEMRPVAAEFDARNSSVPVMPRFRLAPNTASGKGNRLDLADSSKPTPLDAGIRPSLESGSSNTMSSIASQVPQHELRRKKAIFKRRSFLSNSSTDSIHRLANRSGNSAEALSVQHSKQESLPNELEHVSPSSRLRLRNPLAEKDPNQRLHLEDDSTVKLARAMRVSVSPKVKEVFNKLPRKRPSLKQPKTTEILLSRSSSKASHVLGHHVGSREPLRPARGDQIPILSLKEDTSSEDELAR